MADANNSQKHNPSLVFINENRQAVTTSFIIAECLELTHQNVMKNIKTYNKQLETFGLVGFEIQPRSKDKHGGGDIQYAVLNEQQATFLITLSRNTDKTVEFKLALTKAFFDARKKIDDDEDLILLSASDKLEKKLKRSLIGKIDSELLDEILDYAKKLSDESYDCGSISEFQSLTDKYSFLPKDIAITTYRLVQDYQSNKKEIVSLAYQLEELTDKLNVIVRKFKKIESSLYSPISERYYEQISKILEKDTRHRE